MLDAFERFLSSENYRIIAVETLDEVAKIMEVMKVDLVIADTDKSSDVSVFEGLRSIRHKNLNLPIILTATYSDAMISDMADELEISDLILKPFDPDDMKRIVRELVERDNLN